MIVGGLRARLLHDSVQKVVEDGLTSLGWFDPGRAHRPIQLLSEPLRWDEPVAPNALIITSVGREGSFVELGSGFSTDRISLNIDFYAESDTLANHVTNDIRDLLRGRIPTGAPFGSVPILDLQMATPVAIGHAVVLSVGVVRLRPLANRPDLLHWQTVEVDLLDSYYDSSETP